MAERPRRELGPVARRDLAADLVVGDITDVVAGGPADKAGIKPGDVLVSVADKPVKDYSSTLEAISALKPNTSAVLKILRGAKETSLTVSVGLRPKPRREEQQQ